MTLLTIVSENTLLTLLIIFAYLLGSLSSAIIVCKLFGLPDPRAVGSGNPGATNVLRVSAGAKLPAIITLFGDLLKGLVPVLIAKALNYPLLAICLTMLAAFLGHLYPMFFKFKGGKGVATALGGYIGLSWQLAGNWVVIWLLVFAVFRISAVSALVASVAVPFLAWYWLRDVGSVVVISLLVVVLIWRHRSNIKKIIGADPS